MIEPGTVATAVDAGVVTLTGRTAGKSTALAAVGLTEAVPGVTEVVDRLTFDTDDTIPPRAAGPAAQQPPRGRAIRPRHKQPSTAAAGNSDNHFGLSAYAEKMARLEALR